MIHRVIYSIFLLQTSIFVHNFYFGEFFFSEKNYGNFILWKLIFADRKKKPAKIGIAKNSVPHGNWRYVRTRPYMQDAPM